ncbi:MAG TPA: flagellar biosynthetic protein FliR [Steroidobacteraceae bacterium]|nr:flagellar biosynthetic protein FliR [Steroidobacteraceae bacterium]
MSVEAFLPWILSVGLLTVRLTVALALSPAFAAYGVPGIVRVVLTLALAVATFAYQAPVPAAAEWVGQPALLLKPIAAEILVGALLGLGVHAALAAFALAGRLLDVQIGFGIGSVFDPVTRASANVLGSLFSLLGVTLFFVTDAHLALAGLIAQSLEVFPLGRFPALDDPMQPIVATGSMFTFGLALAAPVAIALLLTDLAVGVASRNMPQVNVLVLAIPLKVVVGYLVLSLAVTGWAPLVQHGFSQMADVLGAR